MQIWEQNVELFEKGREILTSDTFLAAVHNFWTVQAVPKVAWFDYQNTHAKFLCVIIIHFIEPIPLLKSSIGTSPASPR